MPLQATSGAASYDAFGGGVAAVPNYIEDVFSTYLYTPAVSNTNINVPNGIDLAGKGGAVWFKNRSISQSHSLVDTVRGGTNLLTPNDTFEAYTASIISAFNSNGFTTGTSSFVSVANQNFVSWTFRKQPKFFDVVTYSGNNGVQNIAHNLGSVPGCIIVKETTNANNWFVYHKDVGTNAFLLLETTNATISPGQNCWNNTAPTSTQFTVGPTSNTNGTGSTYVAYLFAHNAGGFGLTGTDNVISCGSFTRSGSSLIDVNLGYEAQWVLIKNTSSADDWYLFDNMRGMPLAGTAKYLSPNLSNAESSLSAPVVYPTATGFTVDPASGVAGPSGNTSIYIAIRRGPMAVPTDATKVLQIDVGTNNSNGGVVPTNFAVDASIFSYRTTGGLNGLFNDRLRGYGQTNSAGVTPAMQTSGGDGTQGESNYAGSNPFFYKATNSSITRGSNGFNSGGVVTYFLQRTPSFFDEVCYTGNGGYVSYNHNLAAVPELMIVKARSTTSNWSVYVSTLGFANYVRLNTTAAVGGTGDFWYQTPTTTQFSVGGYAEINDTGVTYAAYLFASCPGVSKVGSYTGNGTTQTINCGFTGGARFVLIKRTDSTGGWYVWDTARGMVSGTDPSLLLNSTAAEVNANSIYTTTGGFQIVSTAAGINASGGTYIFLAIA